MWQKHIDSNTSKLAQLKFYLTFMSIVGHQEKIRDHYLLFTIILGARGKETSSEGIYGFCLTKIFPFNSIESYIEKDESFQIPFG